MEGLRGDLASRRRKRSTAVSGRITIPPSDASDASDAPTAQMSNVT